MRVGALDIDPRRRRVAHDGGREEILEPRVMQVFVALIRADGRILSRDELAMSCWGGVVVGEDALNRVIGRLRRLAETLGAGVFEIRTITKVGYSLVITTADQRRIGAIAASGERRSLALPGKASIAVLPFKNLSGDTDQEYLADAISEDIVTALSRWRWFFVVSSPSSFTYKNKEIDPVRISRELGVRHLVSGSIRTSGAQARVTAQLVDALNGSNMWAGKFDRPLVDVFALQDEITEHIASAIEPAMLEGEGERVARKSLADFSALDCFYRGMWWLNKLQDQADTSALALFREAIRLDPDLSLGHAGVARALYARALYDTSDSRLDDLRASLTEARIAIDLDPREATGYYAAAGAALYLGQHEAALHDARQTLALNPNFAYAHYRVGQVLIFAGRPDEAIAPLERSVSLSPCDPQMRLMLETLALAHYQTRSYAAAGELARSAGRMLGGAVSTVLVASLAQMGRTEEAAEALSKVDRSKASRQRPLPAPYADPDSLNHIREGYRLARKARGDDAS